MTADDLNIKKHIKYLKKHLVLLPNHYSNLDSTRLVISFFSVSGLDILNSLDTLSERFKQEIIDWIYRLQVINDDELVSGFQGTSILNTLDNKNKNSLYKWGHIANTYSALCCLLALGDDLSRVHRSSIIKSLKTLQRDDGCFNAAKEGTESDMRFIYCAVCICYILDDWSGIDANKAIDFILKSITYDYGIGQGPELECHGGPTYCAIASLMMLNSMHVLTEKQINGIIRWLVFRQVDGFQGRPNKPVDTCYSFWIGASLKILGVEKFINQEKNYEFVMSTEDFITGGFSKWTDSLADPLHTYLGLGGLSIMGVQNLAELVPTLNITKRAFDHMKSLHMKWKNM